MVTVSLSGMPLNAHSHLTQSYGGGHGADKCSGDQQPGRRSCSAQGRGCMAAGQTSCQQLKEGWVHSPKCAGAAVSAWRLTELRVWTKCCCAGCQYSSWYSTNSWKHSHTFSSSGGDSCCAKLKGILSYILSWNEDFYSKCDPAQQNLW